MNLHQVEEQHFQSPKSSPQRGERICSGRRNKTCHLEQSERSHKRGDFTNFAILRYTQNDCKVAFTLAEGVTHVAHWKNFRKIAFTLAEVLITLGIIGVIAALTIPTVINQIKHKELETGFKSAYSTFSQGFINMRNEDGEGLSKNYTYYDRENDTYPNEQEFENKFYKYSKLKSIGVCDYGGKKIRNYNDTKDANAYFPNINWYPKHLLSNGMCFYSTINASTIMLFVDTNGTKGPNKLGHDCFFFYIDKSDRLVPFKMTKLLTDEEVENVQWPTVEGRPCSIKSKQTGNGIGCTYYAIIDQNPDSPTKGYWESLP